MWRNLARWLMGKRDPGARGKATVTGALAARAPMVANVVLGLAIVAQAAVIALSLSSDAAAGFNERGAPTAGRRAPARLPFESIMAAHLFGSAPRAMLTANAATGSRPPLVLTGIIATGDPRVGLAIVGSGGAGSRVLSVGAEAAPGIMLAEVFPQWVVLQRGGDRLLLRLPGKDPVAPRGGAQTAQRSVPPPDTEETDDSGEASAPAGQDFSPPPLSDSAAIVRAFALRPASVNGAPGERIMGTGLNRRVLAALGLSPGDVITQINGVPVGTGKTPNLMGVLQSGNATLMVVKNGEETSVTLGPSTVADAAALFRQADTY